MEIINALVRSEWSKAKELINSKADVIFNDTLDGWTALHWAVFCNRLDIMYMLIKRGVNVNQQTNSKRTPLHIAVNASNVECVKMLVKYKANVDLKDYNCETPLDDIKKFGITIKNPVAMAKLLIDAGAEVSNICYSNKNIRVAFLSLRKAKCALITTMGVLRKRMKVCKDMVNMIGMMVWESRFEEEWKRGFSK